MATFILFLHIVGASFWIGSMLFLILVLHPFLRELLKEKKIFYRILRRYNFIGTTLILPFMLITGLLNLHYGVGIKEAFSGKGDYSRTFLLKFFLYWLVFALSVFHDYLVGPKGLEEERFRKVARFVGIANLLLSLTIAFLGVKLRFGG